MAESNRRSHSPSSQGMRSTSKPRRPDEAALQRVHSARFLDDHSVYTGGPSHSTNNIASSQSDSEKDESDLCDDAEKDTTEQEIRFGIRDEHDVEATAPELLEKQKTSKSAKLAKDPNLITWDGPDDVENPKNWSMKRKWAATLIVSCFTLISPVSSSMVAPALGTISKDFGIKSDVESQLVLSIFILAYAIGPLFLGPLSEVYGRVPVLQLANLFYLCWNLGCGFAQNKTEMLVFRFLSGLGGSAPLAIGGGILSDCFKPEERGKAIAIYSLAPLLGPAIGPIAGGFITENTTWRWAFWATSIACAFIQLAGLFLLQETYVPKILKRKAAKLRKETGNFALHTEWESPDHTITSVLSRALVRPFILLATQPIIQVMAVYMAVTYGFMYLLLSTFPVLWSDLYHESIGIGSLNYISLGAGFFLGTQISAPVNDAIYRRLKRKNNDVGKPEFRVPLLVPGAILVPVGLFWYGWSSQAHLHWIMPNLGAAIFAMGTIVVFQGLQTYIVDSYSRFAASAVGAVTVLRSLAGFAFPLFAPDMYAALDYGWGNSLLAFVAIFVGWPAPFLLWKYGEKLRLKSRFAAG